MVEWLDIESAPRDGTRVKLLIPYEPSLFDEAACTDGGYWDAEAIWRGDYLGLPDEQGCWRFDGDDGAFDIQPTHWLPLPPPPKGETL